MRGKAAAVGAIVLLALVPILISHTYYVNIASQMLIWGVFALGLNVLVGYAGLVSLGHAALFGVASYAAAWFLAHGVGQLGAATLAVIVGLVVSALFAVLSLRAIGISFLMITLALGQIFWGIGYRWISITGGDNGINIATRPAPFGVSLENPTTFYFATLVVFLLVVAAMRVFARSPLGVSLCGTRDQPRRMTTLGYNVWMIRFIAFMVSGLIAVLAGILYVYYTKFVSPHALSLTTSAEVLLMVIAGGTGTLFGPIMGAVIVVLVKDVVSAYIERWNLVLGLIFVLIVVFMPEGLAPGAQRLYRAALVRARGDGP
jgi:branched-chain amino acid transport system permease protein